MVRMRVIARQRRRKREREKERGERQERNRRASCTYQRIGALTSMFLSLVGRHQLLDTSTHHHPRLLIDELL